jgi:antitoxin component YwqK of YwqJK toxin-antitoxin module
MRATVNVLAITLLIMLNSNSFSAEIEDFDEKEGLIYAKSDTKPFTGKIVLHSKDGKVLLTEANVFNGKMHGLMRKRYDNGNLKEEVSMINGTIEGVCKKGYENGNPKEEVNLHNKQFCGIIRHWYENGQIREELCQFEQKLEE